MKVAVLFGSSSNEHDVSIVSARTIIKNLKPEKYEVTPVYLNKENVFYQMQGNIDSLKDLIEIKNPIEFLKQFDVVFLMVHGKNGEDGTLPAIFDFFNIRYVGNKTLASILTMDKILTKNELERNNIKTTNYMYFTKYNNEFLIDGIKRTKKEIIDIIEHKFSYPVFVKPASSGSSIGISKAKNKKELEDALITALEIDKRILIEESMNARELECAILEKNNEIIASFLGEVLSEEEFYSFEAKYQSKNTKTIIPACVDKTIEKQIREIAIKAFKILGLSNYSRIDFFLTPDNLIYVNEINTIPGFTPISMYPSLLNNYGIKTTEILDTLIENALK